MYFFWFSSAQCHPKNQSTNVTLSFQINASYLEELHPINIKCIKSSKISLKSYNYSMNSIIWKFTKNVEVKGLRKDSPYTAPSNIER